MGDLGDRQQSDGSFHAALSWWTLYLIEDRLKATGWRTAASPCSSVFRQALNRQNGSVETRIRFKK